jgi:hypothetical protein
MLRMRQLTPEFVQQYLGNSPETVRLRRTVSSTAQALMRSKFKCEDMPDFHKSVTQLLRAAYPPWYRSLFMNLTLVPLQ